MADDSAGALLGVAPGTPGSGLARFGRALALQAAGLISDPVLAVYRARAADDRRGPEADLAHQNLAPPTCPAPDAVALIRNLIALSDAYLASLPGPGVADVRAGLAQWQGGAVTPAPAMPNAVADRHLPAALASLLAEQPALAGAIAAARPCLNWVTYDSYGAAAIGQGFVTGNAYALLIGNGGAIPAPDYHLGLFVIAPQVLYRDHRHPAPELYAPLTGPHGWRFAPNDPLQVKPAHQPVWNPSMQPHLIKAGPRPFLCLYGWTRDAEAPAEVIAADDWPALEALRLA